MSEKKRLSTREIFMYFFFISGIFLLPFTNFDGVNFLREYAREAAIYFWILCGGILLVEVFLQKRKVYFPYNSTLVLLFFLFVVWCCFTYLFNFYSIQTNYFKGRSGTSRFVSQVISLLLPSVFLVYCFWNIIRTWTIRQLLIYLRRIIFYSFLFVFVYGFVEFVAIQANSEFLKKLLLSLNFLPFVNKEAFYVQRISSVSFEVPSLGNYLIFVAGWLFSYVLTMKRKGLSLIPTVLLLILTVISGARAAMVIVLLQFVLFLIGLFSVKRYRKVRYHIIQIGLVGSLLIAVLIGGKIAKKMNGQLDFFSVENNISNQTRYGMQYASLKVFADHPITGVGFGQNAFHKQKYYPDWAVTNNYEFEEWYLNEHIPQFPPDFNIYTRLLAETGIVGFLLFLSFLVLCLKRTYQCMEKGKQEEKVLGLILFISFVGFAVNWLQIDYIRQLGFWLCFALLLKLMFNKTIFDR